MKIQEMVALLTIGAMVIGNDCEPNQSIEIQPGVAVVAETGVAEEMGAASGDEVAIETGTASGDEIAIETGTASGDEIAIEIEAGSETGLAENLGDETEFGPTENLGDETESEPTENLGDERESEFTEPPGNGSETEAIEEIAQVIYEFCEVDVTYFDDALFIGDSRTDGLSRYGGLGEADVFASTGMSVYQLWSAQVMGDSKELITLEDMLEQNDYGKIYITLGINEIGYSQTKSIEKFTETIEKLKEYEPDAIIFLQSNLHVSKKRSTNDKVYNNDKINSLNEKIALLADNVNVFYIDCNELFNDENGCLKSDYTYDGIHVYKKHYPEWVTWLLTKGIIK